ncbi:MAG: hypothetical protein IJ745_05020 [Bacteroidales bacterium]|nr:hypothetical protein [Bacteroidales bacterium]
MKPGRITLFFACIIAALAVICTFFPSDGITIGNHTCYLPTIHTLAEASRPAAETQDLPPVDTIPAEVAQLSDSIAFFQSFADSSDTRFWLPDSTFFDDFWAMAEQAAAHNRILRVLHYGDSQIEMDRMTSVLRAYMQRTFGGGGPGMLPFRTIIPTPAVRQSASGSLTHLSSFGDSTVTRSRGNYGPMMQSFRLAGEASVTFRASSHSTVDSLVRQFSHIGVLFNNRGENLRVTIDDKESDTSISASFDATGVDGIIYQAANPTTHFRVRISGNADLYGVTVDNGPGVAVDNIPMRGCSGQQFTLVDREFLTNAYDALDVGMIILQFGGNSVPYLRTPKAISTYCQSIGRQIDYIHEACPQAKILFVGPSDMSTREKGNLQTYPMLPTLIDSLIATANSHGAAFWSIYHAMGGWNSMVHWNSKGLAGSDYIHFSQRGADEMGTRLADAFADNYRLFCMRRRLSQL